MSCSRRSCSTAGSCRPDQHHARRAGRRGPHHRPPPRSRLRTHPTSPKALPHRHRGPDQPPETRLRAGSLTRQWPHRPPYMGRLGSAHLHADTDTTSADSRVPQHRAAGNPKPRTAETKPIPTTSRHPEARRDPAPSPGVAVYPGGSSEEPRDSRAARASALRARAAASRC